MEGGREREGDDGAKEWNGWSQYDIEKELW